MSESILMELYLLFKISLACIVGIIIGFERTKKSKPAGVATYSIICITSCLLTVISMYGFEGSADPTRLIANIITAIGFVAGGVIYTTSKDGNVKVTGITTGATIFCTASLGITIGAGKYVLAIGVILLIELSIYLGILAKKYYKDKNKDLEEEEDLDF